MNDEYSKLIESLKQIRDRFDNNNINDYKEFFLFMEMISKSEKKDPNVEDFLWKIVAAVNERNRRADMRCEPQKQAESGCIDQRYMDNHFFWKGFQNMHVFEKR